MQVAGSIFMPKNLFQEKFAFGIDIGSSIIKIAYTTEQNGELEVHLVNFSKQYLQESVAFLKEKCAGKLQPGQECILTGVGIGASLRYFEDALNIKCKIYPETIKLVDCFMFLAKHQTWDDLIYQPNTNMRSSAASSGKILVDALDGCVASVPGRCTSLLWNDSALEGLSSGETVNYPVILCVAGSAHYIFKVEGDGTFTTIDMYAIAGRTLLALGHLLRVANSYEEIMQLASKGDATKVDQTLGNIGACEEDDNYKHGKQSATKWFALGCAVPDMESDFQKEDLAAALVSMIANSIAQDAFNWSLTENINQVFFVGGIPANSELFRNEIEREFFERCHANHKRHSADCLFIRGGGHLPAIGCLLSNLKCICHN